MSSDTDFVMFAQTLLNKGYEVHIIYQPNHGIFKQNLPHSVKYESWEVLMGM